MRTPRLKVGLDTSFLVPLFVDEHAFHEPTRAEWDRLRLQHVQFVVACHALLECFSVLTRMPPPYGRSPEMVNRLLRENLAQDTEIPGVDAGQVWSCFDEMVSRGASGGSIYDAVIAQASFEAGATVLLTWNVKDFVQLAPAGLEIATPAEYSARTLRLH